MQNAEARKKVDEVIDSGSKAAYHMLKAGMPEPDIEKMIVEVSLTGDEGVLNPEAHLRVLKGLVAACVVRLAKQEMELDNLVSKMISLTGKAQQLGLLGNE